MTGEGWQRVTRQRPCPVCSHDTWCGVAPDGSTAICMRVSTGAKSSTRNGGHLHVLHERTALLPVARPIASVKPAPDWSREYAETLAATTEGDLAEMSEDLSVTLYSLRRLRAARSRRWARAWLFPMCNARGRVVGVRVRAKGPGAPKWSATGSAEGVFLPLDLEPSGVLLIPEGPSSCAACLDLGYAAVGRPSARPGAAAFAALLTLCRDRECVILGENDAKPDGSWPGRRGALFAADLLARVASRLRVVFPPPEFKDVRDWLRAGATRDDLAARIAAAPDVAGSLGTLGVRL